MSSIDVTLEEGGDINGIPDANSNEKTGTTNDSESSLASNIEDERNDVDLIVESNVDGLIEPYSQDQYTESSEEETDGDELLYGLKRSFEKISKAMEKNRSGWRQLANTLMLNGESDNNLFEWRIVELRSMCRNLIRPEYILDSLEQTKQDYAVSLITITKDEFEKQKRRNWTSLDLFRYAARMGHIMSFLVNSHKRYPWWMEPNNIVMQNDSNKSEKSPQKYSINKVLRMSLIANPIYRSKSMIQQIIWFNQTTEAFSDLFPAEKEVELAQCMGYEIYGNDRVIQYQGRVPQKLYYILYGKIELIYVYKLIEGEVHKSMGFLKSKQMTNVEEFENGVPAETYLVAKGRLEVLTIHIEDYLNLTNKANFSSIKTFLHQIDIFQGIPITEAVFKSRMIKIQYFRNGKVVTQNTAKDHYFYVVKSGRVVVARNQGVYDNDMSDLWRVSSVYNLGCRRTENHASVMMQVSSNKLNIKPELDHEHCAEKTEICSESKVVMNPFNIKSQTLIGLQTIHEDEGVESMEELNKSKTMIEITRPREQTFYSPRNPLKPVTNEKDKTDKERITYVKLDSLQSQDVFGLENLENEANSSASHLILISEGAEVILINKRYFMENIDNNTLLEMKKLVKSYMSEEEAKQFIEVDNTWKTYKKILMKKMISLHR